MIPKNFFAMLEASLWRSAFSTRLKHQFVWRITILTRGAVLLGTPSWPLRFGGHVIQVVVKSKWI